MRRPTETEWTEIQATFDRLVTQQADTRERALRRTALHPFVADYVSAMLGAHDGGGPLDDADRADIAPRDEYSSLPAGAMIGAFRVERLIGRGGTGEVYRGARAGGGFAQQVAIKLLRPEAAEHPALFEAERRTLAGLEHPGIARLIDGGTAPDGRPYIVLEFVDGEPIDRWCAAHDADLNRRLALMLETCDAVSFAHSRLIVHRDLKPGNIMVDADGRVRLLDFGLAKLLDDSAPAQTLTRAMLTPDYAAPEQFLRDQTTVATDIYALGGVLYALLAGRGAWHRPGGTASTGLTRAIHDEPEPPSKAAARHERPPIASARIAGDLDAIVLKAMRHDPAQRYQSVASLADDIRRHLRFEPVQARRGTFGYQLRRFVRRHRSATAAAAAAVLALAAGLGAFAWQAHRVAAERDVAQTQARRAEAVNEAVSLMFRNAQDFGKGGAEPAKELLNESAGRLIQTFGQHSPDTAPVVTALAELYLQIEDVVGAQTLLATALDKGVGADDPVAKARLQAMLGMIEGGTGKIDDGLRLIDTADKVFATDPARFRKDRLESGAARAQILRQQGKRDEAIAILQRQLPEAEAEYAGDPRALLIRYNNLAVHLVEANRLDELDTVLKRGEAVAARERQQRTPMAISLIQLRGGWFARRDQQAEALAKFREAAELRRALYGPSRLLATDLMQVGRTELGLGQVAAAIPTLIEAHAMAAQYAGAASPVTLMTAMTLAEGYAHRGDAAKAKALLASVEPGLKPLGTSGILYGAYLRARALTSRAAGRFDDATRDLDMAETIFRQLGAPAEPFAKSIPGLRDALTKARARAR